MKASGAGDAEPAVDSQEPRQSAWPGTPRGRLIARIAVFVAVLVSQLMGLARQRTGDVAVLRVSVIVLAGVFLVATSLDYLSRSRHGF